MISPAKKVAVRVVGGEITNIRNYPFLVGEMRPWSFLNIKSKNSRDGIDASRALIVSEKTKKKKRGRRYRDVGQKSRQMSI